MENLRESWEAAYSLFWSKFDNCFSYAKTAVRARDYVRGLMSGIERKNGWQLAEFIGDEAPYAVQNFLSRAIWDSDKARDQLLKISPSYLLEDGERGSLIIDETGFIKKGSHSAGVKRQYSGTAGRIENSQIGVFMALAGSKGHALVDRELYLPKEWCADRQRLESAGIPVETVFQKKHQLAIKMLERTFSHGIHPQWVLADAIYGSTYEFRKYLLDKKQAYVVAVSKQQHISMNFQQIRVDAAIENFPAEAWNKISAGTGAKGERWYEWAAMKLCWPASEGMSQYLLARRSIKDPLDISYYFCHASDEVTLNDLTRAAGQRWHIESCFEHAKQEVGLDEYEVRSWKGWYRHITLSMVGLLLLNIFKGLGNAVPVGGKIEGGCLKCGGKSPFFG